MYTDGMVSLTVWISLASRRRPSWVVISLHILALSLANFQAAVSQNANFTYSTFENLDNLALLGDAEPYDPSDNHIGVNINSMDSVKYFNLCDNSTLPSNNTSSSYKCTYLVTGRDFTAWIDFYGQNRTLEVRLANGSITDANMTRPLNPLMPPLDLSIIDTVFLEYMYIVGFTGSVYNGKTVTTLKSWTFSSYGMPEVSADPSSTGNASVVKMICRNNCVVAVIAGVSAASGSFLAAFLIAALGWCLLGGKRRNSNAAFEQICYNRLRLFPVATLLW